ncbi:MAG: tRNA uridine-5-carboxymethylaminomethyl(34) synthesis GTPase MnmE [Deltaproteobacteria bacterium]|nr:tRNA uridine-5-carboxymethylaminomethyl(34) synthesis GTPase MnmE [Deltaproteobacteria bacterium]
MTFADTIAAIATPPGIGGIGIIRISGPKSEDIARLLFRSSQPAVDLKSHHLCHGHVISVTSDKILDEVLITLMKKPHSYTGEDVLEIHCHGSPLILQAILTEVSHAGARLAEPGEFTKRAFLNNRIDLCQAEAVADIITARTKRGLEIALSQRKGDLSRKIEDLRQSLIDILAVLETAIDFTEAEVSGEHPGAGDILNSIQSILEDLQNLSSTYDEGKLVRKGVSAVITGKPNVGKSSLLNRLLGENRAIVTAIPGTTRDFIEEFISIRGIPVKLTDTAGIRDPDNIIEKEGVDRVWERLSLADVVITLFDGSSPLTAEDYEIIEKNMSRPITMMGHEQDHLATVIITRIRHKTALEKTAAHLLQARESIAGGLSAEFAAFDIREALGSLGEITGMTSVEEVLDRIFSTFCIGK